MSRPVGNTEFSWIKAVQGGTGITVLSILFSKPPNISLLQNTLNNLQISHPILRSKLTHINNSSNFTFTIPDSPHLQIHQKPKPNITSEPNNKSKPNKSNLNLNFASFHEVLEYELNLNSWSKTIVVDESEDSDDDEGEGEMEKDTDVLFVTVYELQEEGKGKWVVVLRFHTAVCDRISAVTVLKELLEGLKGGGGGGEVKEGVMNKAIEELIPSGKRKKAFWARGVDLLGYSMNAFRFSNLSFCDVEAKRGSGVVRLKLDVNETSRLLYGCSRMKIKLSGALAAAGLIAACSSKNYSDNQSEKYAVVTVTDCRSILDPPLQNHDLGFYHSAILNTHDVDGETELWDLASRCYTSFANALNANKHFTDMGDLNFLMCKAIENPGFTPSSSSRTSFISVFEDPVLDDFNSEVLLEMGVEDYVGCSSVHGIGPSIAVFDTIRDGRLDCACVYPTPLHSKEQMTNLIDHMKIILVEGSL